MHAGVTEDVAVFCPTGQRLGTVELRGNVPRSARFRVACEKCRYAVWRYGLGKQYEGRSIHERAVLVEHEVSCATGRVVSTIVAISPVKGSVRPGRDGVLVEDPDGLILRATEIWNARGRASRRDASEESE